mgnify:CR=1 FL=1
MYNMQQAAQQSQQFNGMKLPHQDLKRPREKEDNGNEKSERSSLENSGDKIAGAKRSHVDSSSPMKRPRTDGELNGSGRQPNNIQGR